MASVRDPQLFTLAPIIALLLAGCSHPAPERCGSSGEVTAQVQFGQVTARVPRGRSDLDVPAMRAAAEATLRARGYVITESYGTKDRAHVEASGAGERRTDRTTIETWSAPGAVILSIDCNETSRRASAKSMLDETLARIGR